MEECKGEVDVRQAREVKITGRNFVAFPRVGPGLVISYAPEKTVAFTGWRRNISTGSTKFITAISAKIFRRAAKPL